jgi:deoxyribonuclease V
VFGDWTSAEPAYELAIEVPATEPYVPGEFFRRELPPVLGVIRALKAPPAVVVIDGYVWLDANGKPGLGAHLHESLGSVVVVGVAKTYYRGAQPVVPVVRGNSAKPLFVSAIGLGLDEAADAVRRMHGSYRIPTLLKRADQLARGH